MYYLFNINLYSVSITLHATYKSSLPFSFTTNRSTTAAPLPRRSLCSALRVDTKSGARSSPAAWQGGGVPRVRSSCCPRCPRRTLSRIRQKYGPQRTRECERDPHRCLLWTARAAIAAVRDAGYSHTIERVKVGRLWLSLQTTGKGESRSALPPNILAPTCRRSISAPSSCTPDRKLPEQDARETPDANSCLLAAATAMQTIHSRLMEVAYWNRIAKILFVFYRAVYDTSKSDALFCSCFLWWQYNIIDYYYYCFCENIICYCSPC